ncbi:MAG: PQQ-binding-like beta-propeller repeat protein [Sphingomonadales bacterium]|nr:PQQ-binding-like beta-propeller repeat protein [Sphingomonadales bacterium]
MIRKALLIGLSLLLMGAGAFLFIGGLMLVWAGLVPIELLTGPLLFASGVQLLRRRASAIHLVVAYLMLEWIVALREVGLDGWGLIPRLSLGCTILAVFVACRIWRQLAPDKLSGSRIARPGWARNVIVAAVVAFPLIVAMASRPSASSPAIAARAEIPAPVDWRSFGGGSNADKFSPLAQINPTNAAKLTLLWDHAEPAKPGGGGPEIRKDEATPLMVGDRVYVCTANNVVVALDAETGALAWRYDPRVDTAGLGPAICRGLAYVETPQQASCARRLLMGTIDARLIAINADNGTPCPGFGTGGTVDLTMGLGTVKKGYYYPTSPPTIANGVAVIGALVRDNAETGEPSGVVRGYDAATGKLRWAWDMGRTAAATSPLGEGETYTRGTPNAWTVFSADAKLGLVFVPTGNATPDFVAEQRRREWEPYSSALVALDLASGEVRWTFQTVHHDLWDNDLSSPPILADLPSTRGGIPAVIFGTKQGQIFVLDRRNGKSVTSVVERPAAQTDVSGEWTAPTQPYSDGMPDLGGPKLTDADMWGITPFDRMLCRIRLRHLRYDGPLTPPSLRGSLVYPGYAGGIDWGGMSYDPGRNLLIAPTMHLAQTLTLIPRGSGKREGNQPQRGTHYSAEQAQFMTKLGIPCQRPPYARITAIDMRTRKIVWQRAAGTAEAIGPRGIPSRLPVTIGAPPVIGGGITTAGDLTFIGAYGDRRLRAIDNITGHEVWSTRLSQGNQATPITFLGPRSKRQIVVMVSGNWADLNASHNVPTHVMAFALAP